MHHDAVQVTEVLGVRVSAGDQPVPNQRVGEATDGVPGFLRGQRSCAAASRSSRRPDRPALILAVGRHRERPAQILLVNANDAVVALQAVIPGDDHRRFVVEARDGGTTRDEASAASGIQAQVLVEVMIVETGDGTAGLRMWVAEVEPDGTPQRSPLRSRAVFA